MKDLNKVEQIGYYVAIEMHKAALEQVTLAQSVIVDIADSKDFPSYTIATKHCYVISIKGILIYAIDTDLDKLQYFMRRANMIAGQM